MSELPFKVAPFVLTRVPLWPIEDFEQVGSKDNWIEELIHLYSSNELLREAIAIASPSLYKALQKKPLQHPQTLALSLWNYINRMAIRATPFGLFSFVAYGTWGKQTSCSFDSKEVTKRARPDMEWIFALVQGLYKNKKNALNFPIRTNPLLICKDDRYFLHYIRRMHKKPSQHPSIRASCLLHSVFRLAKEGCIIQNLLSSLQEEIPSLHLEKTQEMLYSLLEQQFLIPGLLPSLLTHSPFNDILSSTKMLGPNVAQMKQSLDLYNSIPLGSGENALQRAQKEMEVITSASHFLQVDAVLKTSCLRISSHVADELEKTASFLSILSHADETVSAMQAYQAAFINKYGPHHTVPLLELIDEEKGLGSLDQFQTRSPHPPSLSQYWSDWLMRSWQECMCTQKKEIVIEEELLEKSKGKIPSIEDTTLSLDVFCKVYAQSQEAIDQGNFVVSWDQHHWQGGATMGRFLDLLGNEAESQLNEFLRKEEQLEDHVFHAELSYWPSYVRSANVAIHPSLRLHRLDLEGNKSNSLSLEEIYVGSDGHRLYLTLREGKKELVISAGNMLNPTQAPPPLQLIREISLARHQNLRPFSWGALYETAIFLPRVRYGKTILSRARWRLDPSTLICNKQESLITQFTSWADRWGLPAQFLLVQNDQYLWFDRTHLTHLQQIALKLKQGEPLLFSEELHNRWMNSERGHHCPELVVSLLRQVPSKTFLSTIPHISIPTKDRFKLPGSEWLFVQFYLSEKRMDLFLAQSLSELVSLLQKKGATQWFFIRYRDPDPHIRFRIKIPSPELFAEVFPLLEKTSLLWIDSGLIKNMRISGYEREIERYGGLDLIDAVEDLFCADSLAVIQMLQAGRFSCHTSVLRAYSVILFLEGYGYTRDEILLFLLPQEDRSELKGFREHRSQLVNWLNTACTGLEFPIELKTLYTAAQIRMQAMENFRACAGQKPDKTLSGICNHLLHMHCNRLGCDAFAEKQARLYAYQALLHQKHTCHQPSNFSV